MRSRINLIFALTAIYFATGAVAQNSPAPNIDWAAAKAESDARKAAADARKAEAEAESAAAKAQFGDLANITSQGSTTAGDKAGQVEASILSMGTTRTISARIVSDMCIGAPALCAPKGNDDQPSPSTAATETWPSACTDFSDLQPAAPIKLYIVTESEKPTFDTLEIVQAALCGIQNKFDKAIADSDRLQRGGAAPVIAPAAIFSIANIVGNLFRSDYAVQGVTITADDTLLAKSVASEALGKISVPIVLPSIYRPSAMTQDNPLIVILAKMNAVRSRVTELAEQHKKSATSLKSKGTKFAKSAEDHNAVAIQLETAAKSYDDYLAKIALPSEKGMSELAEAARTARMRFDLASGSYLLSVKMHAVGGTTYTKKNFFTFLGSVPFFVSGGTTASFALIEGRTGHVVSTAGYGAAGGFESIGKIHRNRDVR